MSATDPAFELLNRNQRDFPLVERPYLLIGAAQGMSESEVLRLLRHEKESGRISRVGAVFAPNRIGAGTLVGLAVPEAAIETVAGRVSAHPAVNHNYQRSHRYNLWFVVTADSVAVRDEIVRELAGDHPALNLPLEREYHIDLGFDLATGARAAVPRIDVAIPVQLENWQRALVRALQAGLPLLPQPFARIAEQVGVTPEIVIEQLRQWREAGVIRRFGLIVRHHEFGFNANAMAVWQVEAGKVDAIGSLLARQEGVNLCYRRRPQFPIWPYNLFCMLHGHSQEEVESRLVEISAACNLSGLPSQVLFSVRRFKQSGARYIHEAAP